MRKIALVLSTILSIAFATEALADKRVALVIGNATYQNAPRLPNPLNDAESISRMLRDANFDVVENIRDAGNQDLRRALREFADKSLNADMAVVYFAGHGMEVDGQNYLLPTDAVLQRDRDIHDEGISLDRILETIESAKQLRLVILDACRDNPFAQRMTRVSALRSINRGLIAVAPMTVNTLIAYAAKGGSTAEDGKGDNSPFAAALVKHLPTPGLDLRQAFGRVRDDVMQATDNKQEPFVYGSLGGSTVSLVRTASLSATAPAVAAPVATPNPQAELRRDYEYAERVGTIGGWESFLKAHPSGFYADLARAQLNKLAAEQASTTASEKAQKAADEKTRLMKEGAAPAEQAKADTAAKAAQKAKTDAERARKREQDRLAKAERRKRREDARLKAQSDTVALPAKRNAAAGAKAATAVPAASGGSLYAKCNALVPRSDPRDEQLTRPARIEHCMANGGRW